MFSLRLKELRKERQLSQSKVAAAIGYTQSHIASWELNKNEPTAKAITALANLFKVSSDYLLGLEDEYGNIERNYSALTPQKAADPIFSELEKICALLSADDKSQILGFAKARLHEQQKK
ncbi:MAG: helix-turn-helix domain-containing protein [Firmicutes bacterium]|nr:helix-turn-helix domain-containing protein [Bacillota bacterium]